MIEPAPKDSIFLFEFFVALQSLHQTSTGVVGSRELSDAALQRVDVVLGPLTDCPLGLAVVCSLAFKLSCCQCGYAPGAGS